jgi:hypothetical protein
MEQAVRGELCELGVQRRLNKSHASSSVGHDASQVLADDSPERKEELYVTQSVAKAKRLLLCDYVQRDAKRRALLFVWGGYDRAGDVQRACLIAELIQVCAREDAAESSITMALW